MPLGAHGDLKHRGLPTLSGHPVPVWMEAGECVQPAARAVLELLERELQPLSPGQLELRLDQAVEEILEAELVSGLQVRPLAAPSWTKDAELLGRTFPPAVEDRDRQPDLEAAAVQVPTWFS